MLLCDWVSKSKGIAQVLLRCLVDIFVILMVIYGTILSY